MVVAKSLSYQYNFRLFFTIPNQEFAMKEGIHPQYNPVVFQDITTGEMFITRSTMRTSQKIELEGKEYGLVRLEVSSASHPFYTGQQTLVDTEGRIEKFRNRYKR
jgi:large subunit ribosomal protein L31